MQKKKSSVLRTRRLSGKVLTFMIGAEDDTLREFAEDSKTGRAAKTLVKQGSLRITLVALKKGTVLPPRIMWLVPSASRASVVVYNSLPIKERCVPAGSLVTLHAGAAYAVRAREDSGIL